MAVAVSDVKVKRSTLSGSAGNSLTQSDPTLSLGMYVSTTEVPATLNAVFPDVSGDDNTNLTARYACLFVHNAGSATMVATRVYLSGGDPAGGASFALAVDSTAASAVGSSSAQALSATSMTVPGTSVAGLSYSAPTTDAGGISLGDIPAGSVRAIWLRLTGANATASVDAETVTLAIAWE